MKVKEVKLGEFATLYICPVCKKGHQVKLGMKVCDQCGTELEFQKENEENEQNNRD